MNYSTLMQSVDPLLALRALNFEPTQQGAYLKFPCLKCTKEAVIKAYGEKKNVMYCPHCKARGQIISLAMVKLDSSWEEAKDFLQQKAIPFLFKRLDKELGFSYDLTHVKLLSEKGLSKEFCEQMGIGYPKGKTMLAGCIAFTVHNDDGVRIAYYGLKAKDNRPVFHKSFNPEFYLYNFHNLDKDQEVYFTTDLWKCVDIISKGGQAVCNFGLPYLSEMHVLLLQQCHTVLYVRDDVYFKEIQKQAAQLNNYFKFVA